MTLKCGRISVVLKLESTISPIDMCSSLLVIFQSTQKCNDYIHLKYDRFLAV